MSENQQNVSQQKECSAAFNVENAHQLTFEYQEKVHLYACLLEEMTTNFVAYMRKKLCCIFYSESSEELIFTQILFED